MVNEKNENKKLKDFIDSVYTKTISRILKLERKSNKTEEEELELFGLECRFEILDEVFQICETRGRY